MGACPSLGTHLRWSAGKMATAILRPSIGNEVSHRGLVLYTDAVSKAGRYGILRSTV